MRFLPVVSCVCLCASGSMTAAEEIKQSEEVTPPSESTLTTPEKLTLDGREWKLGTEVNEPGKASREYILVTEKPDAWTELFSIQDFLYVDLDPAAFFKLFIDGLKKAAPKDTVESRIIGQSPNALFAEWWIKDKSTLDQHEWFRLLKKGDETLIIRYTTKNMDQVEQARKFWEPFLDSLVDANSLKLHSDNKPVEAEQEIKE